MKGDFAGRGISQKHAVLLHILLFVLWAWAPHAEAETLSSKKDGSWSSSSTWKNLTTGGTHKTPQNGDIVYVNDSIFSFSGFTVGQNGTGGMVIYAGGKLYGSGYLAVEKGYDLYNYGVLHVGGISFYASNNSAGSNFYNRGAAVLGSGLNLWSNTSSIRNSGSLTIGGSMGLSGTIIDSGTLIINGSFNTNAGKITVGGTGSLTINGSSQMTGGTITLGDSTSTAHLNGSVALNGSPTSKIYNYGQVYVGAPGDNYTLTLNDGQVWNYAGAYFYVYSNVTINSGNNGSNQLQNSGYFYINKNMTAYGPSKVVNNDSMFVGSLLKNGADFTNASGAYLQTQDFYNQNGNSQSMTNDGYMLVTRNFTNDWGAYLTGSGGGIKVQGLSVNNGTINGTLDICDTSASNKVDNNSGTLGSNVTSCQYGLIPVVLTYFTAVRQGNAVLLRWHTASEMNDAYFIVLKSTDGQGFKEIGRVQGHGNSIEEHSYSFTDSSHSGGTVYYRLKQLDYNGAFEFSPIARVTNAVAEPIGQLQLYPNPVGEGKLHLQFQAATTGTASVEIYNVAGVRTYTESRPCQAGDNTYSIDSQVLPKGLYICVLHCGGKQYVARFIK